MVENTGKTLHADAFKPVNLPEPVQVEADSAGQPMVVSLPHRQVIAAVDDSWRLDDEWWRREPLSRLYYAVRLASGQRLVLFRDLNDQHWYRQSY